MHPTLRLLVLCNRLPADGLCSFVVRLKIVGLLAVSVQVRQDVQTHHDVLQQLLDLLVALVRRARRLGGRRRLEAEAVVEAVVELGVGPGAKALGGGDGGGLNSRGGLGVPSRARLHTGGGSRLALCEVRLQPLVAGAVL